MIINQIPRDDMLIVFNPIWITGNIFGHTNDFNNGLFIRGKL